MPKTCEPNQRLSANDLADLMETFQEVTDKLQTSHDQLTAKVHRLQGELDVANDALERSRRLAALGEMAAGIAHEIRNPLAAISLDAASLAHETDREHQLQASQRITFAVKSLNAIVQDVLHFAGDTPVRASMLEVEGVCARAVEQCAGVSESEVAIELGPWEVECVAGDAHLVHRALVNVIRNAFEAMSHTPAPEGGHMLSVHSQLNAAGEAVVVVSDTGPGIPGEVSERMFNPFFTTRATGTGLGLAIVHRIVDAHGGRVEVLGQRGDGVRGAEVRLVLLRDLPADQTEAA